MSQLADTETAVPGGGGITFKSFQPRPSVVGGEVMFQDDAYQVFAPGAPQPVVAVGDAVNGGVAFVSIGESFSYDGQFVAFQGIDENGDAAWL